MPQKKRRRIQSSRKTRNRRRSNHERCRSPRHRDAGSAATATPPITRRSSPLPGKYRDNTTPRESAYGLDVRLPHVDLTRPPKTSARGARPLTPPLTASPSEPTLQNNTFAFPIPRPKAQEDDTASQCSMTTWIGDRDGEALPSAKARSFNFDWADERADEPPIPWNRVQAYTDFHDNKVAHEYWQWDRREMKWRHNDAETGEVVYCPSELD